MRTLVAVDIDIVPKLRNHIPERTFSGMCRTGELLRKAASEIERLRRENKALKEKAENALCRQD